MDRPVRHRGEAQSLINRRQQGDLGEASAIEWLTRHGARVWFPLGHSPDADLIAEIARRLLRIQVKTCTLRSRTPNGHERWEVSISTNGDNQSWSGVAKVFDPARFDALFVLTGAGRRWLIPADAIESTHAAHLGGPKYSEFEIEPGDPIDPIVYGDGQPLLESDSPPGEYPSGQRTGSVKPWAYTFAGSNPASPTPSETGFRPSKYDRKLSRSGYAVLNQKRRLTLPRQACIEAGFEDGDRVRVRSMGDGRIVLERVEPPPGTARPRNPEKRA